MQMQKNVKRSAAVLAIFLLPMSATAEDTARRRIGELERQQRELQNELRNLREELEKKSNQRIEEVQRKQGIMTEELRRLREALVLPETKELKSAYGLGPAASKVYGVERGLSIGGYAEANFKNVVSDRHGAKDEFDFLRLVLYLGYKFNDWIVFNSETEFEHGSTGKSGSVSVEFAALDFLLHDALNVRGGLLLVPMGFINEIHEPPFFHGNVRPPVEQQVLPSTWRANGFGLFGELLPGLSYRTYGITSFDAKKFSSAGVRGGRQSGSFELAEDWSWVGRLDYSMPFGLLVGGSVYLGDQGQNQKIAGARQEVFTQIYEAHTQLRTHGLEVRALGAVIDLDDARALSAETGKTIADVMLGYYAEVAYNVLPLLLPDTTHSLAPWFRYSRVDTQNSVPIGLTPDSTQDREFWEFGLSYKPIPQVILKLDYHIQDSEAGSLPDELRIGAGLVF